VQLGHPITSLAARQHGLVTRAQAARRGVNRQAWYRAIGAGRLRAVAPGVAALPGSPATAEQRILAAVLAVGPHAAASHGSAAHLWGVPLAPSTMVDLVTAERSCSTSVPWIRLHTPTDLDDLRAIRRAGIPVVNPLRVLCDLGQTDPDAVIPALEHFMLEGLVSWTAVAAAVRRHSRQGRHGIVALRAALETWAIDGKPPDSELERRMIALLTGSGLPRPEFHARILGHEVDFAYVPERVVLECDGWQSHGRDRAQFEHDRARDAVLAAAGWLVLRFTWLQVTRRGAWVASRIAEVVTSRRAAA
jgi:very-short-patch-repair endonuclease